MVNYAYPTLYEIKMAIGRLWRPEGWGSPMCAVCGQPISRPMHMHHLFVSTRWRRSRYDIRNVVPMHGPLESQCHQERAHGGEKEAMAMRLYMLLGQGNWIKGLGVVLHALREWDFKFNIFVTRKDRYIE